MKTRALCMAFLLTTAISSLASAQFTGGGGGPIGLPGGPGAGTGSISGVVTDAAGDPVEFVAISAIDSANPNVPLFAFAFTDQNGEYTLSGLADGTYDISAADFNGGTADGTATVSNGGNTVLDLQLVAPIVGTISGVVTDAVSGQPIEGVIVSAVGPGGPGGLGGGSTGGGGIIIIGNPSPIAVTDANGEYTLSNVATGTNDVTFENFAYISQTISVDVTQNQNTVQDVQLDPLGFGSISGTVTDSNGDPVDGAWVVLITNNAGFFFGGVGFTQTDAMGNYSFSDVLEGDHEVQVSDFGFPPLTATVSVTVGADTVQDFQFPSNATGDVEGTVTLASNGQPVSGAFVLIPSVFGFAITDANGDYQAANVFEGTQTIIVFSFINFGITIETVDVIANQTVTKDISI